MAVIAPAQLADQTEVGLLEKRIGKFRYPMFAAAV